MATKKQMAGVELEGLVHERDTWVPAIWLDRRRKSLQWIRDIDFMELKEEIFSHRCEKWYKGGVVKAKNCMFCTHCLHNYAFRCMMCGDERSYAGANLLDMICSHCMKALR